MKISKEEFVELILIREELERLKTYLIEKTKQNVDEVVGRDYSNRISNALELEIDLKELDLVNGYSLSELAENRYNYRMNLKQGDKDGE